MEYQGKLWIILNPIAGKGKAATKKPVIEKFMDDNKCNYEIYLTKGPGDALEKVKNLPLAQDDAVIAAGGDGTCNEVVNGLLRRENASKEPPVMGILPIGRGNDFSYTPGISSDVEEAMRALLRRNLRTLDIGLIKGGFFPDGRYFINGVGIGFDTKVGFEAAKLKIKSGLSYVIGALITLIRYEPSPVIQIEYDKKQDTLPAAIVSIVNGRRMGGTFYMGPNALLDDGLFDICYVRHLPNRFTLLKTVASYTKGKQGECAGVYMDRGKHFRLKALEGSMACHCDGETVCYEGKELEITCVPAALKLIGA